MGRRKKVVNESNGEPEELVTNDSKKIRSVIDLDGDTDEDSINEETFLKTSTFNKDARKRLEELLELKREKKELEDFEDYVI
jgi:hypothetical protein